MDHWSKASITNTFFCFYYIRKIILRTRPPNRKIVATVLLRGRFLINLQDIRNLFSIFFVFNLGSSVRAFKNLCMSSF